MKKILLMLTMLLLPALNTYADLRLTTSIPAPGGKFYDIMLNPGSAVLNAACTGAGTLAMTATYELVVCDSTNFFRPTNSVWKQYTHVMGTFIEPTDPNPAIRVGIGYALPHFKLSVGGGLIVSGAYGAGENMPMTGNNYFFAVDPKKGNLISSYRIWPEFSHLAMANKTVLFGEETRALQDFASVLGGEANQIEAYLGTETHSAIVGGELNSTSGSHSFIGGGESNFNEATHAAIAGGMSNTIGGAALYASISGGFNNQIDANAESAHISGGANNIAHGFYDTIGGGNSNTVHGDAASGAATISGGNSNEITLDSNFSTIGGGNDNSVSGVASTIGGGSNNNAQGDGATIGGGRTNNAFGDDTVVAGGTGNDAMGPGNTISGGSTHMINPGSYSTIGGGLGHQMMASYSTIAGGEDNRSTSSHGTVAGGKSNSVMASDSGSIVGGETNVITSGSHSTILGGQSNTITGGNYSMAGGHNTTVTGDGTFAWGTTAATVSQDNAVVFNIAGNMGVGLTDPQAKLHVAGNIQASFPDIDETDGNHLPLYYDWKGGTDEVGYDVAELFPASEDLERGHVVEVGDEPGAKVRKSTQAYSKRVVGVVSTAPAILFEGHTMQMAPKPGESLKDKKPPVALAGRVPVKVTLEGGVIEPGDLLVASSTPGHAMKMTDAQKGMGAVVGKALESYKGEDGKMILMMVNLQ